MSSSAGGAGPFAAYSVASCRARIRARNAVLNAVLHELEPIQTVEAQTVEARGALAGVPYVLKDTWDTAGLPTTGGSWRHRARVPTESSHAHVALAETGAVLLGKSNLCDLAFSAESDNHLRGPVRNPHDPKRTAGGSTGGGAAAVADGMAAFDWGSDLGGSIRGPAAFCGVVGLRLSHASWPVGRHHFPRLAPFFYDFCGMGPLTREVAGARAVVEALRPALKTDPSASGDVGMDLERVVVYAPDKALDAEWPTFAADAARLLDAARVKHVPDTELPTPNVVNEMFNEYLAAHFDEFIATGELPLRQGVPAVLMAILSGGRLDKRVHPNTAMLLAGTAALSIPHRRNRARVAAAVEDLRASLRAIWSRGTLVVSPTCTSRPPRHGTTAFKYRLMTFCKLGNLVDATALALPFGTFPGSALPRSLQILGPPGSERAVLALAEKLEPIARDASFTRSRAP